MIITQTTGQYVILCQTLYKELFNVDFQIGLFFISLPREVVGTVTTEEQLENILNFEPQQLFNLTDSLDNDKNINLNRQSLKCKIATCSTQLLTPNELFYGLYLNKETIKTERGDCAVKQKRKNTRNK